LVSKRYGIFGRRAVKLLRLDAGRADDLSPFLRVVGDKLAELSLRHRDARRGRKSGGARRQMEKLSAAKFHDVSLNVVGSKSSRRENLDF
jgi:hypothetical protein